MRAVWKGVIGFGLVSIPVKVYAASESHSIGLHQVHAADGARIRIERICTADGHPVPAADLASGYELPDGQMVVLTDAELASVPLPTRHRIQVLAFVEPDRLDTLHFDRPYYLAPAEDAAAPAYALLRDAMRQAGRTAVAKLALRQREHLAALQARDDVLILETLRWPDEIRQPDFQLPAATAGEQELAMARQLIDALGDTPDPAELTDGYRTALRALIDAKAADRPIPVAAAQPAAGSDLVAALRASLTAVTSRPGEPLARERESA